MPRSFKKVLVANRGEIAVRVIRTLHEMGIRAVAVHSDVDRAALHVRMADEAYLLGPAAASESYLRIDKVLDAAKRSGCDAIHPGYGFLSENAEFADACERAGITFIGPPARAMRAMGSKTAARAKMAEAGVPIVPGATCSTTDEAIAAAKQIGFPVMLKASAGGGGKGMRLVHEESEMANAWERARSEAKKFFGDDTVYLEKALIKPRHVEIQVLGDRDGHMVHVFERDCSIQRRNQKVVEETPSPAASREPVARMGAIAVQGAKAVGYHSAGTFEFLLAEDGSFYFVRVGAHARARRRAHAARALRVHRDRHPHEPRVPREAVPAPRLRRGQLRHRLHRAQQGRAAGVPRGASRKPAVGGGGGRDRGGKDRRHRRREQRAGRRAGLHAFAVGREPARAHAAPLTRARRETGVSP